MTLKKTFKTNRPVIGMVHFPPLVGYQDYPGLDYIKEKALKEVKILEKAGVDAIMVENNYDIPHHEFVSKDIAALMNTLAELVCKNTSLPVGVSTLWNDYKTSLKICKNTRASFIRVPAFVDRVNTSYGLMTARAKEVVALRKKLGLGHVAILADVQVKHSAMVEKDKSLEKSVKQAIKNKADTIIITGKWTGDSPKLDKLETVRKVAGKFPVLIGSGSTKDNVANLLKYADGIIVGTSIKKGKVQSKKKQTNIKPFEAEIDFKKAKAFVNEVSQRR